MIPPFLPFLPFLPWIYSKPGNLTNKEIGQSLLIGVFGAALIVFVLFIMIFGFSGCAHCKSGQVKLGHECYWPGQTYTTALNGDVIRD